MEQDKVLLEVEKTVAEGKEVNCQMWFQNRKRTKQEAGTNRWQRIQHEQKKEQFRKWRW